MKKIITVSLAILLAFGCCFALSACGKEPSEIPPVVDPSGGNDKDPENPGGNDEPFEVNPAAFTIEQEKYLYGLGEDMLSRNVFSGIYNDQIVDMYSIMGAKSTRLWLQVTNYCTHNPVTNEVSINPDMAQTVNDTIDDLYEKGITHITGMSHYFFPGDGSNHAIPFRDLTEGSDYMIAIDLYRQSFRELAKAFPRVIYWEIGNEYNIPNFLTGPGGAGLTWEMRLDIMMDMMYYGTMGIREGNPNAISVMPSMAAHGGNMNSECYGMTDLLNDIYDRIFSGDWPSTRVDDFFSVLCWHPYSLHKGSSTGQFMPDGNGGFYNWTEANQAIYDVALEREPGVERKVFLTEFGFGHRHPQGDPGNGMEMSDAVASITAAYNMTKQDLPFVEVMHYFKLYEDGAINYAYGEYGLFSGAHEPNEKAYALCELFGGNTELLEKYIII